ncbi:MAG TPA: LysM peptidoglycan-binding domain-containing protein [bacterium]|nr:LysM peptidoglycan-binding domain-containing protein [bacterium]
MKKNIIVVCFLMLLMTGCETIQKKQEVERISAPDEEKISESGNTPIVPEQPVVSSEPVFKPSPSMKKTPRSEKQEIEIQIMQAKSLIETAMEISKNAEKYAQESYNTANQANATSEKALEASNKAIESSAEAAKAANDAADRAIAAAKEAADKAIAAAKEAMDYADQSAQKAIDASNKAIAAANDAADKAITASNKALAACDQVLAELGRVKAMIQTKEFEPVLPEEPQVKTTGGRIYRVKKGDTLSSLTKRFYGEGVCWNKIYNANKSKIKNPNVLIPGTELIIP